MANVRRGGDGLTAVSEDPGLAPGSVRLCLCLRRAVANSGTSSGSRPLALRSRIVLVGINTAGLTLLN
jgi:hypothetical protein